jgi:hypothetical protein
MSKLYNIGAYGIPEKLLAEVRAWHLRLTWSHHAQEEAVNDRYGALSKECYPKFFAGFLTDWQIVELETDGTGHAHKIVVRRWADYRRSLVLVIQKYVHLYDRGLVKTCWTNLNTDNHNTLDKSKFSKI